MGVGGARHLGKRKVQGCGESFILSVSLFDIFSSPDTALIYLFTGTDVFTMYYLIANA